jgi:hypothetical protein
VLAFPVGMVSALFVFGKKGQATFWAKEKRQEKTATKVTFIIFF